jgi:carbonic anhydrase
MKQDAILKVIAKELGTSDLAQINDIFKGETFNHVKFRLAGKKLGHFGYTGNIKSVTKEGVKVFVTNKVKLIKYEDIEQFEKAKPREERPIREKKPVAMVARKPMVPVEKEPKEKRSPRKTPTQGSRFIPAKSR